MSLDICFSAFMFHAMSLRGCVIVLLVTGQRCLKLTKCEPFVAYQLLPDFWTSSVLAIEVAYYLLGIFLWGVGGFFFFSVDNYTIFFKVYSNFT